ncbi:uncharacterized protein [Arachis hypogaea]|uniref:Uncharacterized protein n=1 Tax=Arachis hypogaea TaxID=3818 RepID=A0A445CBX4_ARAHY|nr:uncharacterized protein LOC112765287 [Arachis hypogaea]RYR48460.1 hypothetical protein Ahy_A07g034483 isoform B [Arachis hypogaea]
MRIKFLITLFLFVSYSQAISNSGLHTSFTAEKKGLNSSTTIVQTQQPFENYGSIKETMMFHSKDEEKQELSHASVKRAHSGRGASGGSSDVDRHHRSSASTTASLLPWSSRFCSIKLEKGNNEGIRFCTPSIRRNIQLCFLIHWKSPCFAHTQDQLTSHKSCNSQCFHLP